MKTNLKIKTWTKGPMVLTRQDVDPDDSEDGGGTDANPIQPDYSDPNSQA